MTASPDSFPVTAPLIQPLLRLAPRAGRLAVLATVLAMAALLGGFNGLDLPALAGAASAATLLSLAAAAWIAARAQRSRRISGAQRLAVGLADDPDPVLVTDDTGTPCAANRAGAHCADPQARLSGWSADPAKTLDDMLAETRANGQANREYLLQNSGLRVTSHIAGTARDLIVWRFASLRSGRAPAVDVLGLPCLTLDGGRVRANAAARAFLDLGDDPDAALSVLSRTLRQAAGPGFDTAPARLPDGRWVRVMAVPGPAAAEKAERSDLLLLPDLALPPIDLAASKTASHGFEDIPVALAALDQEGRIVASNRLARSLMGLGDGDSPAFWEIVEGLGRPVSDWLDDARAGRALGRPEVLRATRTPDETFVQIILRRATGLASEGALVAVISDATELKSLEARFVQSQKMQAIGQLAGGVAHDFNNLLTAISGHCDLLLMNRDRYDPDYNDLLQIHQNANRAAALVRQLLAFSRKQTLKAETFRLESLLEDLTHLLTRLVGERIALDLAHDPELSPIRADRRQLEQVIMNLVVNARDAMPMGGTIRIETEALHLASELEHGRARVPPGDYAAIRVIDQGIGIPPAIIDKVFEPFFTTKRPGEGTGLGLSTAYGIVKQMGGYIFADSVEGSGTTFTLYFASQADAAGCAMAGSGSARGDARRGAAGTGQGRAMPAAGPEHRSPGGRDAAPERPAAPVPQTSGATASGSILLVEDEAPVRAFAARALRLQGYQVFEAENGEQALEFLSDPKLSVDLFATDVIMPGIDGPGWVSQALEARPGTPVVFMSGYTEDTLSAALSRTPRAVFLGKPFSLGDLIDTIAQQMTGETVR